MFRTYNFLSVKPPKTDKKAEKFYKKSLKLSVSRIEHPTKLDKTLQEPTMKTDNVNTVTDKRSEGFQRRLIRDRNVPRMVFDVNK